MGLIKGCIRKVADGEATIGVTNMRAIWFAYQPPQGHDDVIGPGDTVKFRAGGTLGQPLRAYAKMTEYAFWYQTIDLVVRCLPGSDQFTRLGTYGALIGDLVVALKALWSSSQAWERFEAGDLAGAAEEVGRVLTDESFLTVLAQVAAKVGKTYGVPESPSSPRSLCPRSCWPPTSWS